MSARQLPPGPAMPRALQTVLMWAYPFAFLRSCRRRYGPVFTLKAGGHPPLIFVCDRDEIQVMLKADERLLRPGDGAAAVEPIVGESSFMLSHGVAHRDARKALLPVLGASAVERHTAMIGGVAERAIETWPIDTPIELHGRLRALTLEVMLRAIVGVGAEPLDSFLEHLHRSVLAMLEVTKTPVLTEPYLRHGPGRTIWRRFLRHREAVDELLFELIDNAKERPANSLLAHFAAVRNADGSPASRRQVRDNVMSMILAGHETTAAQAAWAVQLLAHQPDAQARLAAEARSVGIGRLVRATVEEVLRHRCTFIFAIPRTLTGPVELGGHRCEPPAQVVPCIYLLHHDPNHHPDPHIYESDRFLSASPDPQTWLPWGGGLRRCPGSHLALLEIATILQTLLANRTISARSRKIEEPRWRGVIVTPGSSCRVVLRVRP
ncbi:MAG: cytochrome P450 [Solirubrobacteraceae bacterium]